MVLVDKCLNSNSNTCPIKDSVFINFSKDYELNNGNLFFRVSEFEIYEILWIDNIFYYKSKITKFPKFKRYSHLKKNII